MKLSKPTISLSLAISAIVATHISTASAGAELLTLSLEDLMDMDVTSVSKKSQSIANAPAAIYVVTGKDIERAGVTSIPEALRMVPGMQVAKIDSNKWAVSARGFAGRYSNKLLVLMDGRTIYTPTFSGVYWDAHDTVLEDIDRIEVIRGPGAALWGANAVNGVINIITKSAADTQGTLVSARAGSGGEWMTTFRHGWQMGEATTARVYGKYRDNTHSTLTSGGDANDDWTHQQFGFRVDSQLDENNHLTVQGDIFEEDSNQSRLDQFPSSPTFLSFLEDDIDVSGRNLLLRWTHTGDNGGELTTQLFYDHYERIEPFHRGRNDLYDLDIQYQLPDLANHSITLGGGYRHDRHDTSVTPHLTYMPENDIAETSNLFIQDDISFMEGRLHLILGAKFEHNPLSDEDIEIQPSAKFSFQVNDDHSVWMSASKSVRTPSRAEQDGLIHVTTFPLELMPGLQLPTMFMTTGGRPLASEDVKSYELGYRGKLSDKLFVDVALFDSHYENLRDLDVAGLPTIVFGPVPFAILPGAFNNNDNAHSTGAEIALDWDVSDAWAIKASYSYIENDFESSFSSSGAVLELTGSPSENQFNARSQHQLAENLTLDLWVRYVEGPKDTNIDSYTGFDARLAWQPVEGLELSLVGQNLFDSQHQEFSPEFVVTDETEVERSVYGKVEWRF